MKAADVAPSMVKVSVEVVPVTVEVLPERVKTPKVSFIVMPPNTVTPVGQLATETEYVPSAILAVVTGKVAVPAVPALIVPACVAPT